MPSDAGQFVIVSYGADAGARGSDMSIKRDGSGYVINGDDAKAFLLKMRRSSNMDEQKQSVERAIAHAKETNGCHVCFKPYDPSEPSCNSKECIRRWNRLRQKDAP